MRVLWLSFQKSSNRKLQGYHTRLSHMSRHNSFGKANKGAKKRNVLKRFERVDVLKKLGRFDLNENARVTGLPKTPILP